MDYTSQGQGTLNTVLGAVGTAGTVFGNGLFSGLFCGNSGASSTVSKELFYVQNDLISEKTKNAILTSELGTEVKIVDAFKASVERENNIREELRGYIRDVEKKVDDGFAAQAVLNANVGSAVNLLQNQAAQLFSLTKLGIPNSSLCPGYGNVQVTPVGGGTTIV